MKKKKCLVIIIIFLSTFLKYNPAVNGLTLSEYSISTDKDTYYLNEIINFSVSWNLICGDKEIFFARVEIQNSTNDILWKSADYYEEGFNQKTFKLNPTDLNSTFYSSTQIMIKLVIYDFFNERSPETIVSQSIQLLKHNIKMEIIQLDNSKLYGEIYNFEAKVYQDENSLISNKKINLTIISSNKVIYTLKFKTDLAGILNFNLSSVKYFNPGKNILIFSYSNETFYNDFYFRLEIEVKKISQMIDFEYNKTEFIKKENLNIELNCYYEFLNETYLLSNKDINLKIFDSSQALVYEALHKTDEDGKVSIKIEKDFLNFKSRTGIIRIHIILKGDAYLEEKALIIELKVEELFWQTQEIRNLNSSSFFSILILLSILFIYLVKKNTSKSKEQELSNLSFRY
ncbi:MAG: hypothetical protein ACOC1K_02675 [Nanoarchaeota archaeon]